MTQRAAEIRTGRTWMRIATELAAIKAVRYQAEEKTIVQTSKIGQNPAEILKKLEISTQKPILAIG